MSKYDQDARSAPPNKPKRAGKRTALGFVSVGLIAAAMALMSSGTASAGGHDDTGGGGEPITVRWVMNDTPAGSENPTYPQYIEGSESAAKCGKAIQVDKYSPANAEQRAAIETLIAGGVLGSDHTYDAGVPQVWWFEDQAPCETTPPSSSQTPTAPPVKQVSFTLVPTPGTCDCEDMLIELITTDLERIVFTSDLSTTPITEWPHHLAPGITETITATTKEGATFEGGTVLSATFTNHFDRNVDCKPQTPPTTVTETAPTTVTETAPTTVVATPPATTVTAAVTTTAPAVVTTVFDTTVLVAPALVEDTTVYVPAPQAGSSYAAFPQYAATSGTGVPFYKTASYWWILSALALVVGLIIWAGSRNVASAKPIRAGAHK